MLDLSCDTIVILAGFGASRHAGKPQAQRARLLSHQVVCVREERRLRVVIGVLHPEGGARGKHMLQRPQQCSCISERVRGYDTGLCEENNGNKG